MVGQQSRNGLKATNKRLAKSHRMLEQIDEQSNSPRDTSENVLIAQCHQPSSVAGMIDQATPTNTRATMPAASLVRESMAGSTAKEPKMKRQSMLTKLASSAAAALTPNQVDLSKQLTADYFPQEPPKELEAFKSDNVEKIVEAITVQLQLNFYESLDRKYNGQLARVLEFYSSLRRKVADSEAQNLNITEELAECNERRETLEVEIEQLKELYLTEIKRMEADIAKIHGLQTVTLLRTNTILNRKERTRASKRRQRDSQPLVEDGVSQTRNNYSSILLRSVSPTRHDAKLSASIRDKRVSLPVNNSLKIGPPGLRAPRRRRKYLSGYVEPVQQPTEAEDPQRSVFSHVTLPPDWAKVQGKGCNISECGCDEACYGGDLLPDELENAVLAMKIDQSEDARAIRRTAVIISNRKHVSYDGVLRNLVEILFGTLDVGYLHGQTAGTNEVEPIVDSSTLPEAKKSKGWKKKALRARFLATEDVIYATRPGEQSKRVNERSFRRHRPRSSSFPEKCESRPSENTIDNQDSAVDATTSMISTGYVSEPDQRRTSYFEGDDGTVIERENAKTVIAKLPAEEKIATRPKPARGVTAPSVLNFPYSLSPD